VEARTPFERFIFYRFDYASLVVDAFRAVASNSYRTEARLLSLPITALLIAPPAITLLEARRPFGSEILFALLIVVWPWVLEVPALGTRQNAAEPAWGQQKAARAYDLFMHIGLGLIGLGAVVCLVLEPWPLSDLALAALWAIALAGGADMVRGVTALCLARLYGFPLYGRRSRKIDEP
jgi:hypothetical protein